MMTDQPDTAARCPFCEAQPGQAVTATATQAEAHRAHAGLSLTVRFTDCDYAEMDWYCYLPIGHEGPHQSEVIA